MNDKAKEHLIKERLMHSHNLMAYIISHARSCIAVHDKNMNYLYVSKRYLKEYKVKEQNVIGKHHYEVFPDLPQKWRDVHQRVLAGEVLSAEEDPYYRKDGSIDWTRWECRPWYESDGSIGGLIVYTEIINDRRQIEKNLKESEEKYRTLFARESDAIFIYDPDTTNILDANEATSKLYGYSKDELIGMSCLKLSAEVEKSASVIEKLRKDDEVHVPYRLHRKKDGTIFYVDITGYAITLGDKNLMYAVSKDITKRTQLEKERERLNLDLQQKNKELEQVVYITSHDLRTPLVNIEGFCRELDDSVSDLFSLLQNDTVPQEVREKAASIIQNDIPEAQRYIHSSISKMDSLLSGLLKVSRLGSSELTMEALDMNSIIADVITLSKSKIDEADATLEISELPSCKGNELQINQVFSNIVGNALKYFDPERPLIIKISGYKENGQSVYCIEDNGVGIASEHQGKIFDIFHQLKPKESKGEGLGLTIVKKILGRHHGNIWLESRSGKGSKFYVSLPEV